MKSTVSEAGKGDRNRSYSRAYRSNYERIDWNAKPATSIQRAESNEGAKEQASQGAESEQGAENE